jgi:hypothetical protein
MVVRAPVSFANAAHAVSLGSLAIKSAAVTSPDLVNPRASAVAIFPAPRNPIFNLLAMPPL